jgi:branched-subunit amino acid transport protein
MTWDELLVIVGMALAVYVPKALPLVVASEPLTTRLRPWLQYVAPAVLGALVAPSVLAPGGHLEPPGLSHLPFAVAAVATLVTRSVVPSLAAGLATLAVVAVLRP